MFEFAFGRPVTGDPFPTGRNPWDVARDPSGSSSGSGVAVAAGLCAGALGSDTGGSIRNPAARCGIVGLKPTYGLVSRRGVVPLSWSLDHVGPMTRTVWDTAAILGVIAGRDAGDPTTRDAPAPVPDYTAALEEGVGGMTLGVLRRYALDWPGLHPEVKAANLAACAELERQGARLVDVDAPTLDLTFGMWVPFLAEAYEYHAETIRRRPQDYREGVRTRIHMGALVPASDLLRAQRLRGRLRREVLAVLARVDAILLPAQGAPAARFEEISTREVMPPMARYTMPWNLVGLPAAAVPCGFTGDGLPVSLQIVGRPFDEATVLRIGRAYERATDWHARRPDPAGWRAG
jgi:aspartyl-tRNA(Asn)/glutamyl-tRNA(Gln) amidotransferase subunit A